MTETMFDPSAFPMKECPKCGGTVFYIKERLSGMCSIRFNADGTQSDLSDMYDDVTGKQVGKYCYCDACHKRLFKLEE